MAAAGLKSFCRRRLTFLYKKFHLGSNGAALSLSQSYPFPIVVQLEFSILGDEICTTNSTAELQCRLEK
ncbi:RAD-like 6 [Prunus dulcis]|uniref:RAD-like 6 n=1 Tax=Prunus dulcis TaxID=3755 RepID=A0A4Y1RU92_PRUDU|nr:RAD-like 6 [Prunus dulcis]